MKQPFERQQQVSLKRGQPCGHHVLEAAGVDSVRIADIKKYLFEAKQEYKGK